MKRGLKCLTSAIKGCYAASEGTFPDEEGTEMCDITAWTPALEREGTFPDEEGTEIRSAVPTR